MDLSNIPLVILAGGKGTRITEYSKTIPKPMIKIGNKPIIKHIIDYYEYYGVNKFIIASGYKDKIIREYFKANQNIKVVNTGLNTLTGGRLLRLKNYLPNNFFLTYGDGLSDVDILKLYKLHLSKKKIATVTAVHPIARFGEIRIKQNIVVSFNEKPRVKNDWINGGFFVFNKKIFKFIKNDFSVLEQEPMRKIVKIHELVVLKHEGFWQCMDTAREKIILENLYKLKNCPWKKE